MNEIGFDTNLYVSLQTKQIAELAANCGEKLYIEIGGKLIQDKHAARVLPGYREDARFEVVKELSTLAETILVVSAKDIIKKRIRGDFKITYDKEALRKINKLRLKGLVVNIVIISLLEKDDLASELIVEFEKELQKEGIAHYRFFNSDMYKSLVLKTADFEINPFVSTASKIVLVISPGGGSGKFGVCLSQLFHEMKKGVVPQYFSLGAFPMYDIPKNHPINLAYRAACADFNDLLCEDPNKTNSFLTVREIENFKLFKQLAENFPTEGVHMRKIISASDMCISSLSKGITDEEIVCKESAAEIGRRYMRYKFEVSRGQEKEDTLGRVREIFSLL